MAELDFAIGGFADLGDRLDNIHGALKAKPKATGLHKKTVGTLFNIANTGPVIINTNQNPAAGRVWNITGVGLYGADAHTAVAGVVGDFYIGDYSSINVDGGALQAPLVDNVVGGLAVPSQQSFSKDVYWCREQEWPYVILYTVAITQQYVLRVTYTDFDSCDVEEQRV